MKNTNRRRTSPEIRTSLASWIALGEGRLEIWIYVGNIIYAPKIDVFLFAPRLGSARTGPIRQGPRNTLSSIQVYACSVLPQLLDTTMDVPRWEGTVLLEPWIHYRVSTQPSRITYAPWHTFDERMKWSWWGTHLPVFRKLIIIPLSNDMYRQSLWSHGETTQELFCTRWSHSSHSWLKQSIKAPLNDVPISSSSIALSKIFDFSSRTGAT